MGFLKKLFGQQPDGDDTAPSPPAAPEHAVIVYFDNYGSTDLTNLFAVEDRLRAAIEGCGLGEVDGHEINTDGSDGTFYVYGQDADAMFEAIKPILLSEGWLREAKVLMRYGPPEDGVREKRIKLKPV